MINLRPVAYVIGRILIVLAILMLAPAILDWRGGDPNWMAFLKSALVTGLVGGAITLATANSLGAFLDVRQAYLLTALIWTCVPVFGALPFWFGAPGLPFVGALFESTSGFTTTGATVIVGLDTLPLGMNLWRGMTNWLGGLGIAFIAMIFLPLMRIGGMQFFRTEGFDTFGKALPRATDIAKQLALVYSLLTAVCIAVYSAIGMVPIDAVVNAFSTIATGGFSPTDISFTKYQGAGEYAGAFFMILAVFPYIRYVQLVNGAPRPLWTDPQARAFLRWLLGATLAVALWRVAVSDMTFEPAFREALFNLTSIMSGTGFFSGGFVTWGGFALVVAFVLGLIGGCSGSSSGALTVFRVQIALGILGQQVRQISVPSRVDPVKYQGRTVDADVIQSVIMFTTSYIVVLGVLSVAMTLTGVDWVSSTFAIWQGMGNIGYGYGDAVARTGTFVDFPPSAQILVIVSMALGRIGMLAFLVLILPDFWRR